MADDKAPETDATQPQADATQPLTVVIQQPDRAGEAAKAMLEGKALKMDEASQPGGVYIVNGQKVNANGDKPGSSLEKSS